MLYSELRAQSLGKFCCLPVSDWVLKSPNSWNVRIIRICWQWHVGPWEIPFALVATYFLLPIIPPNGFDTMSDVFYFRLVRLEKCGWCIVPDIPMRRPCGPLDLFLSIGNCWNSDASLWRVVITRKQGYHHRQPRRKRRNCGVLYGCSTISALCDNTIVLSS